MKLKKEGSSFSALDLMDDTDAAGTSKIMSQKILKSED